MNEYAIQTKNLKKYFAGVHAIDGLSINLTRGSTTGIVGPNGSGKTTLINIVTGMTPFDSGTIVVAGSELEKIISHEISTFGITRTFQNIRLLEQMTVLDNILVVLTERAIGRSLRERHGPTHLARAQWLLETVQLWGKRDENANNLSYGQRKLLEIARALAMNSDIIFFDEPFAGLFPEMRKLVEEIINGLKKQGKTIILVEHNMDLIRSLSDHVIVMDAGKILAEGKPDQVLSRTDVIEAYLGE